jgi:NMD protein affecting ribosome stability and mRNA decay
MTHFGGPGPTIRERRPKASRPCLNCGRRIVTTIAARLCGTCLLRAAVLAGGIETASVRSALSRGRRT